MKNNLIDRENTSIFQTYKRLPIVVDYAYGSRIFDKNGKSYLDFLGGIAVNALGHCHPKTIEAIEVQIRKFMHVSNYYYQEPQIELAEKLKEMTGYDRAFFTNSGTEAIEGAMKLCRRWGSKNKKSLLVSFKGGFHGRTYGALSLMDKPHYKDGMQPFLDGVSILEYNNTEQLEKEINEATCAVFMEFIQGEGGVISATGQFVSKLNELRKKFGFLIVADEIQSGVGRTGKFFGFENYDIKPDIVILAKGIGGGLPLGCILAKESLAGVWEKGMHGTTNGGNSVACAAGLTVLKEIEDGLMDNVRINGEYLFSRLENVQKAFPEFIIEIRGKGLMCGIFLTFDAAKLMDMLLENGVITNAASGNVLRLVPPLIVGRKEIDEFIDAITDCLNEIKEAA
ncbi:aspartate aminotransferase family protein [Bacteroidota bacterium]